MVKINSMMMDNAVIRRTTIKEIVSKYINDGYRSRC